MGKTMYDPWSKITTRNGYACDEVISALQKSIRRGLEEQACMFAYELYISSPQLEEKLWRRLLTISVEDIGMGNPMAAIMVNNLAQMRLNFDYADNDRTMYFIHAIRYMCDSEKDRSSDLLKNICIKSFAMGKFPEIPDVALDKHTQRGQAMGRDSFHFLNEASVVIPQAEINNNYKERYAEILKEYDPKNVADTTFTFNGWQF